VHCQFIYVFFFFLQQKKVSVTFIKKSRNMNQQGVLVDRKKMPSSRTSLQIQQLG